IRVRILSLQSNQLRKFFPVSTPQVSKGVNNAKVIAPGMFRISSDKISREAKKVPNTLSANSRTKPITVSQPFVITKKGINSNSNGLSSTGLDNTKTRRPQPRNNSKNDRVPSASKRSRSLKKVVKVEEPYRNLLLFKKNKHSSSACNSSKIDSQDVKSKVVCAKCKKCLNSVNHDVCLYNCVNGKKSHGNLKLLINFVWKFMGTVRFGNDHVAAILSFGDLLWGNILINRVYFVEGKLAAPSGDNACTSNTMEPKIKRFPNSTSLLGRLSRFVCGVSTQAVPST
nr:integrase, catalytic region, zinc finger, CCHC-type, peptidase aspartic, catalytic [Tanacetum cinerariifolium]